MNHFKTMTPHEVHFLNYDPPFRMKSILTINPHKAHVISVTHHTCKRMPLPKHTQTYRKPIIYKTPINADFKSLVVHGVNVF